MRKRFTSASEFTTSATQRLVGEFELLRHGGAGHNGISGGDDFLVFHPASIVLKVFNLGLEFLLLGLQETGFEFGQVADEGGGLIAANLLEQRLDPGAGFGGAPSVEIVSRRPEMFFGVPEVQLLTGVGEAVLDQVPNPHGTVSDDQHLLGLA